MASSSCTVMLAVILSVLLCFSVDAKIIPTSRPEMINAICKTVRDAETCRRTVAANPDAAAAKDLMSMASVVIGIGATHAKETLDFINRTIKADPTVKPAFEQCASYYLNIYTSMKVAAGDELKEDPMSANYDVMVTMDDTKMTMDALNAVTAGASVNALKEKTVKMNGFIDLGVGATNAVEEYYGDH